MSWSTAVQSEHSEVIRRQGVGDERQSPSAHLEGPNCHPPHRARATHLANHQVTSRDLSAEFRSLIPATDDRGPLRPGHPAGFNFLEVQPARCAK